MGRWPANCLRPGRRQTSRSVPVAAGKIPADAIRSPNPRRARPTTRFMASSIRISAPAHPSGRASSRCRGPPGIARRRSPRAPVPNRAGVEGDAGGHVGSQLTSKGAPEPVRCSTGQLIVRSKRRLTLRGSPPIASFIHVGRDAPRGVETTLEREQEVERLYRTEGGRLWRAVMAYCGDREIANDAVAESFRAGDRARRGGPCAASVALAERLPDRAGRAEGSSAGRPAGRPRQLRGARVAHRRAPRAQAALAEPAGGGDSARLRGSFHR